MSGKLKDVGKFLEAIDGFKLYKTTSQKVLVKNDSSCNMYEVLVNNKIIMMGNSWDFHPGCYGLYDIPDFRGAFDLADIFMRYFKSQNISAELVKKDYIYR